MTSEERPDPFEHVVAGVSEQYVKYREEYRQLWRETQRQLAELGVRVIQMGEELREADRRLEQRIAQLGDEARAQDKALGERIDKLVSGIGQLLQRPLS